jgi:hypothetical protein
MSIEMIQVIAGTIEVHVGKPDDMPDKEFDDYIEANYHDITVALDNTAQIKTALVAYGEPLHGFIVDVKIKDH